jgi:hypothetical protein
MPGAKPPPPLLTPLACTRPTMMFGVQAEAFLANIAVSIPVGAWASVTAPWLRLIYWRGPGERGSRCPAASFHDGRVRSGPKADPGHGGNFCRLQRIA